MKEEGNGKKLEHRLTKLEVNVKTIMDNHLPHIQAAVDKMSTKFGWFTTLLFANLVGIIVSLIK